MKIILFPDPRLKQLSAPVSEPLEPQFIKEMHDTMHSAGGVGLSAIQVGVPKRVVVARHAGQNYTFINPSWVVRLVEGASKAKAVLEGCLSTPGFFETVYRYPEIKVIYQDEELQPKELDASFLLAQIVQHECEHLDGKMFLDHLKAADRARIMGSMIKFKRSGKK